MFLNLTGLKIPISITILARKLQLLQATYLKKTYENAIPKCPISIKSVVSSAKVEKVVNPPHIPTFKNKDKFLIVFGFKSFEILVKK